MTLLSGLFELQTADCANTRSLKVNGQRCLGFGQFVRCSPFCESRLGRVEPTLGLIDGGLCLLSGIPDLGGVCTRCFEARRRLRYSDLCRVWLSVDLYGVLVGSSVDFRRHGSLALA